jgi:hypothetical protein
VKRRNQTMLTNRPGPYARPNHRGILNLESKQVNCSGIISA